MKLPVTHTNTEHGLRFLLEIAVILVTLGQLCSAQEQAQGYDPKDPKLMKMQAHRHNTDMSCCAPCAPETNLDADVFKRPCFTRSIGKAREGFGAYLGLTDAVEIRVSQDAIPVGTIVGFEKLLTNLLQPGFLPPVWDRANFVVPYPGKSVMEVREGVMTFVGHAVDRTAVAAKEISASDPIQGTWTVGGIEVLPRMTAIVDRPNGAIIRLRLHSDDRLVVKPRPADFQPGARRWREGWDYLDNLAFNDLLKKVFQVPFDGPNDFVIKGHDSEYEGVRVFHGSIRSREWQLARKVPETNQTPPHWWDEMRLLVTDSDPQYFCVSIVLGRDDVIPAPQP